MRTNWQYLLLAFALAVFSWHLVSGREKVDTWIQVPVEIINSPQGYVVRQGMVNRIEVRIRGPRPMVRTIDMRNAFYPLDLADLQSGLNVLEFDTRNIALSRAIEVVEISPSRVELLVDRLMTKTVPVEMNVEVALHEDFELRRSTLRPPEVVIRGPQTILEEVSAVQTQVVKIEDQRPGLWDGAIGLVLPAEVEVQPARVNIQLDFGEKRTDLSSDVLVQFQPPTGMEVTVQPAKVALLLQVPMSRFHDQSWLESVTVTTQPLGELAPGEHEVSYRVDLPSDIILVEGKPEKVLVGIKEMEAEEGTEKEVGS
jgi:YbbR domain-containing protein